MTVSLPVQSLSLNPEAWNRQALLTCDEMRRAEALACARGPVTFYGLMQVAGRAVAQAAMDRFPKGRALVLCGSGNNGGDGYVAAEALRQAGWTVKVGALAPPATPDTTKAAQAWQGVTEPISPDLLAEADLVIDALFGTGLTRPLEGVAAAVAEVLAKRPIPVVAADFPSGVEGDGGRVPGPAMQADVTVTFFRKKRGHVLLPGRLRCGETLVADTGMAPDVLSQVEFLTAENHSDLWRHLEPKLEADGHKYQRGHALILGGDVLTGASRLAARAAQRIGAGLVTLAVPQAAWEVYARALESVMVAPLDQPFAWPTLLADPKKTCLLIGPGLGLAPERRKDILAALATRKPCVIDADALSLFADEPSVLLGALHEQCVMTPHEGEFARLFGADKTTDKVTRAQKAAAQAGCVVLLKGADTVIAHPCGGAVINTNAPPTLATAGAGDVLAGLILGLLTAGMPPFAAACAGAFRHGQLAQLKGPGLIAEDLVEAIPALLRQELIK